MTAKIATLATSDSYI